MNIKISFSLRFLIAVALLALIAGGVSGVVGSWAFSRVSADRFFGALEKGRQEQIVGLLYEHDEEERIVRVAREASGAVVSIIVERNAADVSGQTGPLFFEQFGFPFPFDIPNGSGGDTGKEKQESKESAPPDGAEQKVRVGGGSGFIVSSDGLILTNKHVVDDKRATYKVALDGGTEYDAQVLDTDPFLDVAIIKIDAQNLPVLPLGDSDSLAIGQTVIAIGNTLSQFSNTVTRGVVSGKGRRVVAGNTFGVGEVLEEAIQTDAAINPGNSGGPLLTMKGEVVGIATATSLEGEAVSFAIPINAVKRVIESVKATGHIVRAWLGVRYTIITKEMASLNKLPVEHGALVVRGSDQKRLAVIPGSPADKAGLEENNIILEFDGEPIDKDYSLARMVSEHSPGDRVILKVYDDGEEREVEVVLGEYPLARPE